MVTEDYVSFEIAKLLKEKGFDEATIGYYPIVGKAKETFHKGAAYRWNYLSDRGIAAPTLSMAMKWLRKEHGLHCHSDYDIVLGWYCQITSLTETVEYDYEEMKHYHPDKDNGFSYPEEACEEAIRYCLKNLV